MRTILKKESSGGGDFNHQKTVWYKRIERYKKCNLSLPPIRQD